MIEHIRLKSGSSSLSPPVEFDLTPVTVFVGPNNSGKSKVLAEIGSQCVAGQPMHDDVVLSELRFRQFTRVEAVHNLDRLAAQLNAGEVLQQGHVMVGKLGMRQQVYKDHFIMALENPNSSEWRAPFAQLFMRYQTLTLNGRNRIDLVNDQSGGDLQQPAQTTFQQLFRDDELRQKLRRLVHRALGLYPVVDPTALGQLRLRLSKVRPPSDEIEKGLTRDSIEFHRAAPHIQVTSDGVKAFVGILAEILAGDPEILLVDEPEAFLHPSLAFLLGQEIAESIAQTGKRMFVSTHSPQFLMGCIQSGLPINVVRLTYRDGSATARLLPSADLVRMMRHPLLRSTGIITALFYESVIVTESDADRAFYQEINERLLRLAPSRGVPHCIFLNAQNKQTIPTIIGPLRHLGIPTAGIYDIDFVKDGGIDGTRYLASASMPSLSQQAIAMMRAAVLQALKSTERNFKREGGIELLNSSDKDAAINYLEQLEAYGIFVVRGGELENWLKAFSVAGHGPSWLVAMFERMGEDPGAVGYVHAGSDDVWEFMDRVRSWLIDSRRKGIPY